MAWLQLQTDLGARKPDEVESRLEELGAVAITLQDAAAASTSFTLTGGETSTTNAASVQIPLTTSDMNAIKQDAAQPSAGASRAANKGCTLTSRL